MSKKLSYSLKSMAFMLIVTSAIFIFAVGLPEYIGDIKTVFIMLGVISAIQTLRIAGKVKT